MTHLVYRLSQRCYLSPAWKLYGWAGLAGFFLGFSGDTITVAGHDYLCGGLWWLAMVVWWANVMAPTLGGRHYLLIGRATMVMTFIGHLVFTRWLWGLHPLTWLGISEWASGLAACGAWVVWAALFAGLWGVFSVVISWVGRLTVPVTTPTLAAVMMVLVGLTYPWWVTGVGLLTDMYVHWLDPVATWVDWPGVVALVPGVGRDGVLALMMASSGLVGLGVYFGIEPRLKKSLVNPLAAIGVGAAIPVMLICWPMPVGDSGHTLPPVALYQHNLPIEVVRQSPPPEISSYLAALENAHHPTGTWVVLPEEGIVRGWVDETQPTRNADVARLQQLADQRQWHIVTGLTTARRGRQGHLSAFGSESSYQESWRFFNTLAVVSPHQPWQAYHKRHLVPFGEIIPNGLGGLALTPLDGWATTVLKAIGFGYIPEFTPGDGVNSMGVATAGGRFGGGPFYLWPTICFELALPPDVQGNDLPGNAMVVNVSNLGWFHGSTLLAQQFWAKGRLLATQLERPVVIAANTGPSGIIDARGRRLAQLPMNQSVHLLVSP